jgi:antitoxin component of MazEF toxin-antitoxin module
MTEIIFKDNSIQTGYRIKIPKAIIDTLELKEGQEIRIKFDVDKRILIIEEDELKKTVKKIKKLAGGKRK